MSMPRDEMFVDIADAWGNYLAALGKAINKLEKDLKEAQSLAAECTNEWCQALKHKLHDLYAGYRQTFAKVS
ncbi:MAG: hypothetical protein P8X55_16195 [Desulfosarcinaceae bacterium]